MSLGLEVAAGVIPKDGALLLAKRSKGDLKGLWEFPGGKRKDGEGLEECLIRELYEELGIKVKVVRLICKNNSNFKGENINISFFLCEIEEGVPIPQEGQEIGLFKLQDLDSICLAPPDRVALREIKKEVEAYVQKEEGCCL